MTNHRDRSRVSTGLLAGVLALLALGSVPARAASHTMVGELKLDLPDAAEGWTSTPGKGGAILLQKAFRDGDRKGAALIQVLQPIRTGSFEANWRQVIAIVPELADEKPTTDESGKTLAGQPIRVEHRCCGDRQGVSLASSNVGIETESGQNFFTLVTMNADSDARRAAEEDFKRLVRSARAGGAAEAPALSPSGNGGGLDGVFTSLYTGVSPNAFGGMDFVSESRVMMFEPSGLYSRAIPGGGADLASHCRREPTDCGTYELTAGGLLGGPDRITLNDVSSDYGIVETETKAFKRDSSDITVGDTDWARIPPLAAGTPFAGTWRYFWASSGTTAFSSGGVSSERLLTMNKDGTFTRSGSYGVSTSNESGGATTGMAGSGERPIERGRYEAEGYALRLTAEDGRTETLSLFEPDGDSDKLLVIDGNNYLKQDGSD